MISQPSAMDNKKKILVEALTLFSEKGYSAVRMQDIAVAVGIKAPSLYKHYKSKQAIFNACVELFSHQVLQVQMNLRLPNTPRADFSYQTATTEKIVEIAAQLFEFHLIDDIAAKFRRMLIIERYHNSALDTLFEEIFINGAVEHEERIFAQLMQDGIIRAGDPHVIALRFYTPIFYLLQKYDTQPEKLDDAKNELTAQVREFCELYQVQKNGGAHDSKKG